MQHIYQVLSEVDPLKFIENTESFKEYNEVVSEMHTQYIKENDFKFKKYIVFDAFQKLFWEDACSDQNCTLISDLINERLENKTFQNFCTECGVNMGDDNPRQLCGKRMCLDNEYIFE